MSLEAGDSLVQRKDGSLARVCLGVEDDVATEDTGVIVVDVLDYGVLIERRALRHDLLVGEPAKVPPIGGLKDAASGGGKRFHPRQSVIYVFLTMLRRREGRYEALETFINFLPGSGKTISAPIGGQTERVRIRRHDRQG